MRLTILTFYTLILQLETWLAQNILCKSGAQIRLLRITDGVVLRYMILK